MSARDRRLLNKVTHRFIRPLEELLCTSLRVFFCHFTLQDFILSFHIAGFQYADGALVLGDLKAGDKLTLCAERDNPHDPEAVAIYYGNTKLGYVPGNEVGPLSLMMYYGHEDVFEARVQQVAPERSPWHQVRVELYVVDAR